MIEDRIRPDVPLAPRTTLGVGGPARHYLTAERDEDILEADRWARDHAVPLLVVGGGSNILVADAGFGGLVVEIATGGIAVERHGEDALVTAAAGESWDGLVDACVAQDLAGIECLSGIPGRVGATPIQNVGAYGQEIRETIESVRAYDRAEGRVTELGPVDCDLGYRSSVFKRGTGDRWIVLGVRLRLRPGGPPAVRYPELGTALGPGAVSPTLAVVRRTVLALRRAKSMLIDPADPESRSAGSFFLNVVVDAAGLAALVAHGRKTGALVADEEPPQFAAGEGRTKVPAGFLIERAGCRRGETLGGARISHKHALALVNAGRATAADIAALADSIRARVRASFGVALTQEPVPVGFEAG